MARLSIRGLRLGAQTRAEFSRRQSFRLNYASIPGRIVNFMMYSMYSGVSDILVCSVILRYARMFPGVCISGIA